MRWFRWYEWLIAYFIIIMPWSVAIPFAIVVLLINYGLGRVYDQRGT